MVTNCNLTIAFLDKLEETRILNSHEAAFRKIVKSHILNLLAMQKAYWRQRFTQRLMQFGDENTKVFHAMASERYRQNVICQIADDTGRMVLTIVRRVLFFNDFKRRLDTSVATSM